MKNLTEIETISLASAKDGVINVGVIAEPYGEGSESVASVAITLNGDSTEPDWKVHIPKDNIDAICEALKKAKEQM
jgi:hypothetical protein